MKKTALLVRDPRGLLLLVIGYEGRKCRQGTEAAMQRTGYSASIRVVAVHFEGVKCGRVDWDGGLSEYGLWLLFRLGSGRDRNGPAGAFQGTTVRSARIRTTTPRI